MKTKTLFIIALLCFKVILKAQFGPSCLPSNGLVAYWPLDNINNGNSTVGSFPGTVFGAVPTNDRYSVAGMAYDFNGTTDYILSSYAGIQGANARAVSFWAKSTGTGGVNGMYAVTWGNNVTGERFGCCLDAPAGRLAVGAANCGAVYPAAPGTLNGNWHHFVFQFSGTPPNNTLGSVEVYQDAVYVGAVVPGQSSNISQVLNTLTSGSAFGVSIGRVNYSSNYSYFKGAIDDIGIWDRLLDICEIKKIYNCNTSCTTTDIPPSSCCLGNLCTNAPNSLTGNYQIPLSNFNFNFTNPSGSSSQVLIGYSTCNASNSKLNVTDDNLGTGIKGYCSTSNRNNIGIHGSANDPTGVNPGLTTIGVLGDISMTRENKAAGVAGFCGPALLASLPPAQDVGVYGNSTANGGVWAGYFDGDVNINGNGWLSGSMPILSDQRFKTSINGLTDATEKLKKIKGYTYKFKTDEFKSKNFPKTEQIGFMAQELKEVFPQLVLENKEGYFGVHYIGLIPVLVEAAKEQQNLIEKQSESIQNQQKQIDELKSMVQSLAGNSTNKSVGISGTPVNLSDKNTIVLDQNVPNPFAESTVISYNIPTDFTKAQIIFTKADGTVIKSVNITEKGKGTLNVFGNDLSHGMYSYTLVVDGKNIDTKKMVKE